MATTATITDSHGYRMVATFIGGGKVTIRDSYGHTLTETTQEWASRCDKALDAGAKLS